MFIKEYNQEEIRNNFRKKKCLECKNGILEYKKSSPNGGWILYYQCNKCKTIYAFTETDMGQTLPDLKSNAL